MGKIGDQFVDDMIDRGRREAGAFFFQDSNIAQATYPLRGGYWFAKEAQSPGVEKHESTLDDRLQQVGVSRDDRGRDERDRGMELE